MANDDLRKYLDLDEDDLLELLGAELLGNGPGFGPEDFERQIRFASEWLQRKRTDLRAKLCGEALRTVTKQDGLDALEQAAAVTDALFGMLGHPSASIVAAILLKRGLTSLCRDNIA